MFGKKKPTRQGAAPLRQKEDQENMAQKSEPQTKRPSAAQQIKAEITALRKVVQRGGTALMDGQDPIKEIADRLDAVERAQMTVIEEIAMLKTSHEEVVRGQNIMMTTLRELLHS